MLLSSKLARASAFIGLIERGFVLLAIVSSAAIMLIVSVDTILRYAFHAPLFWSIDVVSRYLMVAIFYMAVSYTFQRGDHIRVVAFRRFLNGRATVVADVAVYGSAAAIFATIGLRMLSVAVAQWQSGEAFIGVYMYPNWITSAIVALGSLLLACRLLVRSLQRLLDVGSGREDADIEEDEIEELIL